MVFPAEAADVRARSIRTGGAVAPERVSEEHFGKAQFVQRNRLQAALADIVVAAAGERAGGTARTVRFAGAYRHPVVGFTWPGAGDLAGLIGEESAWTLPMGRRPAASMGTTMNVTGSAAASEGPFGCRTRSPGVPRS